MRPPWHRGSGRSHRQRRGRQLPCRGARGLWTQREAPASHTSPEVPAPGSPAPAPPAHPRASPRLQGPAGRARWVRRAGRDELTPGRPRPLPAAAGSALAAPFILPAPRRRRRHRSPAPAPARALAAPGPDEPLPAARARARRGPRRGSRRPAESQPEVRGRRALAARGSGSDLGPGPLPRTLPGARGPSAARQRHLLSARGSARPVGPGSADWAGGRMALGWGGGVRCLGSSVSSPAGPPAAPLLQLTTSTCSEPHRSATPHGLNCPSCSLSQVSCFTFRLGNAQLSSWHRISTPPAPPCPQTLRPSPHASPQ